MSGSGPRGGQVDRRTVIGAAVLLAVAIIGGTVAVAVFVDDGPRRDTQGQLAEDGGAKPHIIERPNSGTAPQDPGDRGGWAQLGLLALIVAAVTAIGLIALRGGAKARAGRAAWRAAAESGRDGAASTTSAKRPS